MDTAHTPGEWSASINDPAEWYESREDIEITAVQENGGAFIASVPVCASYPEDSVANARLISAAPELLAACEQVLHKLDYLHGLWGAEAVSRRVADLCRTAVRKAKEGVPS